MAYQTNPLVMGEERHRFSDPIRTATPVLVLLWLASSLLTPFYYGVE